MELDFHVASEGFAAQLTLPMEVEVGLGEGLEAAVWTLTGLEPDHVVLVSHPD